MKQNALDLKSIMEYAGKIAKGASLAVIELPTGKRYAPKSVTEYVAAPFTALENGEALIAANKPKVGVRSIDGVELSAGRIQVVTGVRMLVDTTLSASDDAAIAGAAFASVAPGYVKNGEVRINQNAELVRLSGSDCHNFKASTGNDADFREVSPFVLRDQTPFQINIKLAGAPTANHAFKFEWRAIEFVEVQKA